MVRKKVSLATITLSVGAFLIVLSYLAFLYWDNGFIGEVYSEVFGVGAGIFVFGLALLFFGKKIN